MSRKNPAPLFFLLLFGFVLAARMCHRSVLWADEDYHLAAAIQVLHGKIPYRDLWYDKPPLNLLFYLLFDARPGWILRLADALFVTGTSAVAFHFGQRLWSRREGFLGASLLAFYLVFYLPDATIPLEPDTLMILPHLLAVYFAIRGRAFSAGVASGIAFLFNAKGLFVLAICGVLCGTSVLGAGGLASLGLMLAGFAVPSAIVLGGLAALGAFGDYIRQVWQWGLLYIQNPAPGVVQRGMAMALSWTGFHAALVLGAAVYWSKTRSKQAAQLALWAAISLIGTGLGWRFTPRYFNQLLPALVIPAARGFAITWEKTAASIRARGNGASKLAWITLVTLIVVAMLIPVVRFGPRYVELARDELIGSPHHWTDVEMDQDSRRAAEIIRRLEHPGDTIFVWGYRPDMVAYSRLSVASRFWDSQPLTGVPADRHLVSGRPIAEEWAAANRREFIQSAPAFFVDGLSILSPRLDVHLWSLRYLPPTLMKFIGPWLYPELRPWLAQYCEVNRTRFSIIYRRCETGPAP